MLLNDNICISFARGYLKNYIYVLIFQCVIILDLEKNRLLSLIYHVAIPLVPFQYITFVLLFVIAIYACEVPLIQS